MKLQSKIIITSLLTLISFGFSACTFSKIIWYNFSGIDDYKIFANTELIPANNPSRFVENDKSSFINELIKKEKPGISFDSLLESNNTTAFLILKNDTLIYEKYFKEYYDSSLSLSFSMAKSFLSLLIGCAIDDSLIKSVEQPVTDYVPELKNNGYEKVEIKHLVQMTSGMDYNEADHPFAVHPYYYYGSDLEEKLLSLELENEPGIEFRYKSGEAQLLGLILKRALKTKSITEYMHERIWTPLGMEYSGLWSIDGEDTKFEKVFCCLSARAKDFAKFGRLYLNKGKWNGKQIVSQGWIEQSTQVDTSEGSAWYYQYMWWLVSKERKDYTAIGHLGQFVYVNPDKNIIIVRLGESEGDLSRQEWKELFALLSEII